MTAKPKKSTGKAKAKTAGAKSPKKSPQSGAKKRGNPQNLMPPWKPGQSGNPSGRTKGTKNAILSRALEDLQKDWLANGMQAIADMREKNPARYVEVVFAMMPKEFALDDETQEGFAGIWAALAKASASKEE
jgi:hypothetical protein